MAVEVSRMSRVNQGETSAAIKVRLDRGKLAGGMMALRESERKGDERERWGVGGADRACPAGAAFRTRVAPRDWFEGLLAGWFSRRCAGLVVG